MIELERLNGETFLLNAFMIEQIQSNPDTTITLFNGKKMVVQTPKTDVLEKVTDYYRRIGIIGSIGRLGEQL